MSNSSLKEKLKEIFFFFLSPQPPPNPICFHQSRVSEHRRPGGQGQLWPAGSNSGSAVDQRKHPGLQRRPKTSDHFWLWRRSVVRQPAHPLALLRRYVHSLSGMHNRTETALSGSPFHRCQFCCKCASSHDLIQSSSGYI